MPNFIATAENAFRLLVDDAKDYAIFLMSIEGRIETWNSGAARIFGRAAGEVIGQPFSSLFTPEDRAAGVPQRELQKARDQGRAEDARWHLRGDGGAFFADGITTAVRDESGKLAGFTKLARDITEHYRAELRLAAQLALTSLLNGERPIAETARDVLQTVCETLRWDIGALWKVDDAAERITAVDRWHDPSIPPDVADELTDGFAFRRGEGLPGEVWEAGHAIWVTEIDDPARFPRAGRAVRAGIHAAFAFPIAHGGRILGAMEFFSRETREPDQALLPVMTLAGAQIGDYIDRLRSGQALRESEEKYRVVSEAAPDAIFTIDEEGIIRFCNPAVERVFGYKPDELIGQPIDVIVPERFRSAQHRGIEQFLRNHERTIPRSGYEFAGLHRSGHEFPIEVSFGVSTARGRTIFTGYARDITDRKRAVEEMQRLFHQEQEARAEAEGTRAQLERRADEEAAFRHLASALAGAIETSDVLHEITNRATAVTRADGVYVERVIVPFKTVEVLAASGRGTPRRGLRVAYPGSMTEEIMKEREPVILTDMETFGKSMAPYLIDTCSKCEVLVTPLVADEETLGALVLLNSRHSGRTFGDNDIVRARTLGDLTSLALRRVRLMEQERAAKEQAEAAVHTRDETLGIVSHDLRNPLTKVALSADLLADAPPEEQPELVATIRLAARQMQRLIEDLLDVARVETGRFSINKAVIAAEPIVRHACDSNQPIAGRKQQKIVCAIEASLPDICADRDRIVQVFANLIGNAMKFTPERGTITVTARAEPKVVVFQISDTGPGIPEADLKNVFHPYWQAKKTAHMGAGLGLAIVKGIVEAHGGSVWAENAPGGGAVFAFTIPSA